jgi:hypothetical protein
MITNVYSNSAFVTGGNSASLTSITVAHAGMGDLRYHNSTQQMQVYNGHRGCPWQ